MAEIDYLQNYPLIWEKHRELKFECLTGLTYSDREALVFVVKAANVMDEIFYLQAWYSNPSLRDWLKEHADTSELNKLKWSYYQINKSPSSSLDEDEAFLSTADSAIRLLSKATRIVKDWKGLEYRAAFPLLKPAGANFYPPDMDKMEFELWKDGLAKHGQKEATGFFSVIKRHSEFILDSHQSDNKAGSHDLYIVPYSEEYKSLLAKAAVLLHKAGDVSDSPSLKRLLHSKADAFLSNDYYDSDIAWMELDSKLDVTIGPYETYEDKLFGYKVIIALQFFCATFEAYIGIRDDEATAQLKLLGDYLLVLCFNLSIVNHNLCLKLSNRKFYIEELFQDVKGPQTLAFNLPNDEHIVKDRGSSMVMLKNVSEAKFKHILLPIAAACVAKEQQEHVDFESFFTRSICHECCHGIGPHTITLPNGQKSTVRLLISFLLIQELQEFYSALEEAKADIVGLWALRFLISQDLLSDSLLKSMYVSFLAGCFQSVRFGLEEAHGKGQALQFNWLYEKGAFVWDSEGTISVDFTKIEGAIESLSREILTIQAKGDKENAGLLLQKYCVG
ncbi:nudix hydrolase 3-like [Glycine soja]|nr:nudix hydrolase 3-like [Glycine soja]